MRLFWQTLFFWTILGGCQETIDAGGYLWVPDPTLPVCHTYDWVQRDPVAVQRICSSYKHPYTIGCSHVAGACLVISMYDEETADKVYLPGATWSHRKHEVQGHLMNRWSHP